MRDLAFLVSFSWLLACASCAETAPSPARDSGQRGGDGDGDSRGDGDGDDDLGDGDGDGDDDPSPATESACDGLDNDGDGKVDNVDVAGDGICDCLSIATIGAPLYPMDDTFRAWLDTRSGGVVALNDMPLTDELLAPFQVLVVQSLHDHSYSPSEVEVVERWVRAGGGLFALTAYTADSNANVNALLAPYGISYGTNLVLVNILADRSLPVDIWLPHPVTQGVTKVGAVSAYEVLGGGTVLARGQNQPLPPLPANEVVMMRATAHEKGKVIAWGDEWITYDSEWSSHADYQVERLWQNALGWLGPENECDVLQLL